MSKNTPKKTSDTDEEPSSQLEPLEVEIDRQIGDLVPQKAREEVVRRVTTAVYSEFFSGPIAHPRHLREYESICPGAADRIVSMAEVNMNHRIGMDHKIVDAEIADQKRGMFLGAACLALLLILAFLSAVFTGSEVIPGLFLGTAAFGAIGMFIKGRNNG